MGKVIVLPTEAYKEAQKAKMALKAYLDAVSSEAGYIIDWSVPGEIEITKIKE